MSAKSSGIPGGLAGAPGIEITSWDDVGGEKSIKTSQTNNSAMSVNEGKLQSLSSKATTAYNAGQYMDALNWCEQVYEMDAFRTENLLMLGAIHFQLRNFSECIFYNQQCIRVDASFAESYSNLGNALKELGDYYSAIEFYNKAIKLKPRFCDAYNNLASVYMQLGETDQAMETYNMALVLNPALVDAHNNLGNLFKTQGDLESSKKCYLEAIRIKPDFAVAWNNLAGVFKDEGQIGTAVSYYKEATRLCPEFADAHSNLGNALKEQNLLDEAIVSYKTAIKLRPDFAIAHGNLGTCQFDLGDVQQAVRTFKYALQLEPNYPDAYNSLGNAQRDLGQLEEAIQSFRSALRLKPDHPHAYNNLGNAMKDKGLIKEAVHCYVTAVRIMPKFAAAHSNLASLLKEQGKLEQSLAHYHEAITIEPLFADAYSNLGNLYKDFGKTEEAVKCYATAIKINPDFAVAHSNLAAAYKDSGDITSAIASYRRALELKPDFSDAFVNLVHSCISICDWSSFEEDQAKVAQILQEQLMESNSFLPSIQPFHSLAFPLSLQEMKQIAERYSRKALDSVALAETRFNLRLKARIQRVKVGYVSSDFGNHPLSHLMQSVFGLHNRDRFEVTCYALTPSDKSRWRGRIETEVEYFKDISQLQAADAAQLIYNDGIHILVNLNGFTKGAKNELFALRPAHVQLSMVGFCGTSGASYMDYMVADPITIPSENRSFYTEKILYMPHTYVINDHKQSARFVVDGSVAPPTRGRYGLSEDKFVFCNFGQLYKIDPLIFDTWMNILKRVQNSVLWLLKFPPDGEVNIRAEARKRGVREDQIHFSDVAANDEHLLRGGLADLFLDTSVCNAHTTSCDILWSGTPLITLIGDRMSSRVSASILTSIGTPELVCESYEEYEEMAVSLAEDSEQLFTFRRKLERSRENCAAYDTERWVRNLEAGYDEIMGKLERDQLYEDIYIEDVLPVAIESDESLFG